MENATGELLAEITFPQVLDHVCITHTYVSEQLRGQGIAEMLVKEAIREIQKQNMSFTTSCSYANVWVKAHPAWQSGWLQEQDAKSV